MTDAAARLLPFALASGAALAVALTTYPALRLPTRRRTCVVVTAIVLILLTPLLVPPAARLLRFLGAVLAVTLTVKLFDLHLGARAGHVPTLPQFLAFLPNIYSLVHRASLRAPRPPLRQELRSAARAVLLLVASTVLAILAFRHNWRPRPFALEHVAKVLAFFLVLVPLSTISAVIWRLLGGHALDFMDNPFAARTPADFWRRYNRPVHEFFDENLFRPLAGRGRERRSRALPALLVFVVSAAVHEYVFAPAVGRVQGYQAAFFLLQGLAVAATLRIKPRGTRAVFWTAATLAFNLATGVLFFASLNQVLPIYQHRVPLWDE